jgi:hypothetical protein
MGRAAYVQASFAGGEYSQAAQGRIDLPTYRTALNVCLNAVPIEAGAWQRRGGTRLAGLARGGLAAKLIGFDFEQPFPYQIEISAGFFRYWSEVSLVTTNDDATISAISGANPAVITTTAAHGWSTGNQARVASNVKLLLRRDLAITVLSPTTFSIADAVTGTAINGGALEAFTAGTVSRIGETATPYTGDLWRSVRSIQAETTAVLVNGTQPPYVLTVTQQPTEATFAQFALAQADFLDGPYLDPISGSWATASALSGVVTITLSFQSYDAAKAYNIGDYVTSGGQGYISRVANNQGHTPASSPTQWRAVNAGDPINGGAGFIAADIGRLIRLFSEPPLWTATASYSAGQIVAYTVGDQTSYALATGAITPNLPPGTSLSWSILTGAAVARWTWGRILSVSASGITAPDFQVGDMTGGGGLASAFDGNTSKSFASSANNSQATPTRQAWVPFPWSLGAEVQYGGIFYRLDFVFISGFTINFGIPPAGYPFWTNIGTAASLSFDHQVGGHLPAPTQISSAIITPTTDVGFTNAGQLILNLRASATLPTTAADGTLIGTTGVIANTFSPVAVVSTDQTTAWNYAWFEPLASFNQPLPDDGSHIFTAKLGVAQVQFFAPNIATGAVISVQIAGDALLYTNACRKWRLGLFGGSNGYPKCGTYDDNRIWLSGVSGNRVDSSKSGAFRNGALVLDMAPTAPDGTVTDAHAISATFTAPDVNAIFWMEPDQQGILCGTQAGEWLVGPAAPGALSPLNIKADRVTTIGCADILPRRTDHTLVFVQRYLQKVQEYFADVYSGKFSSPHLTKNSKHLTPPKLAEIAYQEELAPIVWARLANGALIGITYQRDSLTTARGPDLAGAHRHTLGSGRAVRSISVGASASGNLDSLYMATEEANGGTFHIEMMTRLLSEGFAFSDCWFLDDALVPTSFAIDATPITGAPYGGVYLYGLWPLNGKTVAAYLVGLDCGSRGRTDANVQTITDFVVSNGAIFVPFGDGISQGCGDGLFTNALVAPFVGAASLPMVVGFPFTSDGQIVRPATPQESGSRIGPALGMLRRTDNAAAQLYGCVSQTIAFGDDFDHLLPAILTDKARVELTPQQLFSGVHRMPIEGNHDFDSMLCWRISRPYPAFVISVAGFLKTEEP